MEHTTITQDIQLLHNKAQILGSLLLAVQGRVAQQGDNQQLQGDMNSLTLLWSELAGCLDELSQDFEYLQDLSAQNNIPELLWALKG